MKLEDIEKAAYENSGLVSKLDDGTYQCKRCEGTGCDIMSIHHKPDCQLQQGIKKAIREPAAQGNVAHNLGADEFPEGFRAEVMSKLTLEERNAIAALVERLRYAPDATARLAVANAIRTVVPTVDKDILMAYVVQGMINSKQADLFMLHLMFELGASREESQIAEELAKLQKRREEYDMRLSEVLSSRKK